MTGGVSTSLRCVCVCACVCMCVCACLLSPPWDDKWRIHLTNASVHVCVFACLCACDCGVSDGMQTGAVVHLHTRIPAYTHEIALYY
jgi:hypothetical protein